MTVLRRGREWMLEPAPATRLAVFRILCGLFATGYLAARLPVFWSLAGRDPSAFDPVGVLGWLDQPFGPGTVEAIVVTCLVLGACFTAGVAFRVTGPAFAIALLVLTSYRSSFGQVLYFENLMVIHIIIVGISPAAEALALARSRATEPTPAPHTRYGWPLHVAALVSATAYVVAGIAKLRIGGLGWATGSTLRNHIAFSATRLGVLGGAPSPLARPVMRAEWLLTLAAIGTLVVELGAPLALWRRARTTWVAATWVLHAGIAATMFVVFPYPLALVAFAPLFDLERLVRRRSMSQRRQAGSSE